MEMHTTSTDAPVALVTGASRGLGLALTQGLADRGWHLIIDGRHGATLDAARSVLTGRTRVTAVRGDVADAAHRAKLAAVVERTGRLDLLVNNASTLGPSPLPALAEVAEDTLIEVYRTNTIAPLLLLQAVLPRLEATGGTMIAITSDAAGGPWPGWGVYGSSKAALEQLVGVLGAEHPALTVYAVDPGDLRTDMHQAAFPDEDISDRPEPRTVVPAVLSLLDTRPPSGRYRAAELVRAGVR